jgi:MerR family transcriptional regulator, thiopeptide resistance regulator
MSDRTYRVGELARLAHVSVRTLHHYDAMGLLRPSGRSEADYRLYTGADLERLQQVLFYRELGLPLAEIRRVVSDPAFDRRTALRAQRELVAGKSARLQALLQLIDTTLASLEGWTTMSDKEMFEAFGDFDPREHEQEAKERWGHREAYKESARRTRGFTKEDWAAVKAEGDAINADMAALLDAGVPADDARAINVAERHRLMIDGRFYPCSPEMHTNLGEMYVVDARFTATYEKVRPGLARYMRDAIRANAARAGVES